MAIRSFIRSKLSIQICNVCGEMIYPWQSWRVQKVRVLEDWKPIAEIDRKTLLYNDGWSVYFTHRRHDTT